MNNVILAGQMSVDQVELAFASGTIASIANDGRITLTSGPVLRINDPNAKYSAGYNRLPFYTADDENPSISSFSGVPMCVPRNSTDPLCPSSNRPTGVTTL